ncbi:putative ribonuclease H-like domain-containing protein [Tanacetum coccineum]
MRGNLVRGLPSKIFENDYFCVACQKGKQQKASCKAKLVNSISKPWHMLHMDLFGLINVKCLMKKFYCLVVTDDFSRFSWVFFLATKDETSRILMTFITKIGNQLDYKVKVIRSNNGTEFKNSVMNQFYEMKGIKREFSVARTPQQNGVSEMKNRTLIEDARTMLVDSKLPITFWDKAVNTACYVLNRVLVIKPDSKTPYELILRRTPLIDFMKPFGSPVTILNTKDHLSKFDGKADEGFFVGYSMEIKLMVLQELEIILEEDARVKPTEVDESEASNKNGKDEQDSRSEFERIPQQEKQTKHPNITNSINTVSTPVSTVEPSSTNDAPSSLVNAAKTSEEHLFEQFSPFKNAFILPDVPNVSPMDDNTRNFAGAYDDEDVGGQVDLNNLETTMNIEAMQEELLQFKLQKVWTLVDLPNGKRAIGTKWVFRNKKDDRGIDRSNQVIYLAYASKFMGYYVPDGCKELLFLYGTIKEEVYVDDIIFGSTKKSLCDKFEGLMHKRFQMSSMGELTFFLGFQVQQKEDGIFISQDKYVAEILKKFDFATAKTANTLIETNKALVKDEEAKAVDVHLYRSMIGSLMYLPASRPYIIFYVCACARFQVTPKTSHIHAVKRVFIYFKGQPKLGLWYPRDSPFDLEAFSNSDYARATLDRKSTIGGCQFLRRRLISWQCKKQTIVANSTTKAEYIVAANCCSQVLWIQNQMLDYGFNFMNTKIYIDNESTICIVKNPVFHSKTKHIEIRHHFIRDSYEKKLIQMIKIHTDDNVADLLTKAFDVSRFNFLIANIGLLNLCCGSKIKCLIMGSTS